MSGFRKIAREAIIFALAGFALAAILGCIVYHRSESSRKRKRATEEVYAVDVTERPDIIQQHSVLVPLTNGTKLSVTDCSQAHRIDFSKYVSPQMPLSPDTNVNHVPLVPIPVGASNGSDCMYFSDKSKAADFGGHLVSVPLGDANQVAIEKIYWDAYRSTRTDYSALISASLLFSLLGFPSGLVIWIFYRLVKFAITG